MSDPDKPDKPDAEAPEHGNEGFGRRSGRLRPGNQVVDRHGHPSARQEPAEREPKGVIERWAFELLKDYRQERALQNIVDINGQVLRQLSDNEDRWVYVSLGRRRVPPETPQPHQGCTKNTALRPRPGHRRGLLRPRPHHRQPPGREGPGHQLHRGAVAGLLDQRRTHRGTAVPLHRRRPEAPAELGSPVPAQEQRRDGGRTVMTTEESDRARVARVIALAERTFANREKAGLWLHKSLACVDGRRPIDLIQTTSGTRLVEDILAKIAWGATA